MTTIALTFQNTQFDIIDRNNQPWLRLLQIGGALGYSKPDLVGKVYQKYSDEFTDGMTALVEMDTEGGKQQVRVFSLRGCHLLAMLSRTKIAKEFIKWVLDILDNQPVQHGLKQLPEPHTISKAQIGVLYTRVNSIAGHDNKMRVAIWSRFQNHFKINSYKELPAINYDDACIYLDNRSEEYRQGVDMLYISSKELEDRIDERIKALEPQPVIHELRTKLLLCIEDGVISQSVVPYGSCIVDPASELSITTVINEYAPVALLNNIILAASQKLHLINNRAQA